MLFVSWFVCVCVCVCACMSTDPDGLPKLSEKQRRHLDHWVRPDDICEDPKMVYLVSSFTVKQVMYIISVVCFNGNVQFTHHKSSNIQSI